MRILVNKHFQHGNKKSSRGELKKSGIKLITKQRKDRPYGVVMAVPTVPLWEGQQGNSRVTQLRPPQAATGFHT